MQTQNIGLVIQLILAKVEGVLNPFYKGFYKEVSLNFIFQTITNLRIFPSTLDRQSILNVKFDILGLRTKR